MITGEEELYGFEVVKEVLDMAIVEHARQLETLDHLNIQSLGPGDVVAMIRRFRPSLARMKEAK